MDIDATAGTESRLERDDAHNVEIGARREVYQSPRLTRLDLLMTSGENSLATEDGILGGGNAS